jgi:glycosyl transferase, family 25
MVTSLTNQNIDAIYVLSVKKFTDRIAHIQNELAKHHICFNFIFEYDLGSIDPLLEKKTFGTQPNIEPPQRSLVLKHISAWKKCVQNNYKNILVFEDDVILHQFFNQEIELVMKDIAKKDPSYLIFLGGADTRVPKEYFLTQEKIIRNPIATADGYITDLAACQKRLTWLESHQVTLPADHLLKLIDQQLNITQYWSYRPLVEQGSVFGMFTSTLDGKRKNKSNLYNLLRYRLKIVTRRTIPGIYHRIMRLLSNSITKYIR